MQHLKAFFLTALASATSGGRRYHLWMGSLTLIMLIGAFAYGIQLREGLSVTGMNDHVSWGLYISNFTFLVGLAAAAMMVVLPAYVLADVDFSRAVLIAEGVAVAALVMCLAFVVVDLGNPLRSWHLSPGIGCLNWPRSMLAWDVIVLNGYLLLNLSIPFYILYGHYTGRQREKSKYLPWIYISVLWAVSIHMVTAFLLAALPSRPFWNTSLLGPRFLASAFTGGPAFLMYLLLNLSIPFYILYGHYTGRQREKSKYLPWIYISVLWAVSIHMVTAFLLAALPSRPFWNTSLLGPRFLASAFTGGPAFMILLL